VDHFKGCAVATGRRGGRSPSLVAGGRVRGRRRAEQTGAAKSQWTLGGAALGGAWGGRGPGLAPTRGGNNLSAATCPQWAHAPLRAASEACGAARGGPQARGGPKAPPPNEAAGGKETRTEMATRLDCQTANKWACSSLWIGHSID